MPSRLSTGGRTGRPGAFLALICAVTMFAAGAIAALGAGESPATAIAVEGDIGPVTAEFVRRSIDDAEDAGSEILVIRLDTPGGLVTSMRDIVSDIRGSSLTTVVWIGPDGGRAGSAGAFITAAADHVAMAPATNIGSATPISSGGQDLDRKIVNDSAAFIASVADATGHDGETYRRMVTEGLNLTAAEALEQGVSDATIADAAELADWIAGRTARDGGRLPAPGTLEFGGPSFFLQVLQILSNPNLVFLLLLLGVAGVGLELFSPGALVPGVVGVISLVLALAGLTVLPFAWAGLALIGLGIALLALEILVPGIGALAVGGIVALTLGGFFLIGGDDPGQSISRPLVIAIAVAVGAAFVFAGRKVITARRNPVAIGGSEMIGSRGEVARPIRDGEGQVRINGEIWGARAESGVVLESGAIEVVAVGEDLTLTVRAAPE